MAIVLSLEDRRRSAYHEGGRALVGMLTSGAGDELEELIRIALGGRCAEALAFGQPATSVGDDEVLRIVEESRAVVLSLLRANRWRLDALASALLKYETLDESMAYAAAGLPEPGSAPGSFAAVAFSAAPPAA